MCKHAVSVSFCILFDSFEFWSTNVTWSTAQHRTTAHSIGHDFALINAYFNSCFFFVISLTPQFIRVSFCALLFHFISLHIDIFLLSLFRVRLMFCFLLASFVFGVFWLSLLSRLAIALNRWLSSVYGRHLLLRIGCQSMLINIALVWAFYFQRNGITRSRANTCVRIHRRCIGTLLEPNAMQKWNMLITPTTEQYHGVFVIFVVVHSSILCVFHFDSNDNQTWNSQRTKKKKKEKQFNV